MDSYYYGNIEGQYRGIGDTAAEKIIAASIDADNMIFCNFDGSNMCIRIRPQRNAIAPSRFVQAGIYRDCGMEFIGADFLEEEQVLRNVVSMEAEPLKPLESLNLTDDSEEIITVIKYILCRTVEVYQYGGTLPTIMLGCSGAAFEEKVREIAYRLFKTLPEKVYSGKGICTGEMSDAPVELIRIVPFDSKAEETIHYSDCEAQLRNIRKKIKAIVDFWIENHDLVEAYGGITASIRVWNTIMDINHWENADVLTDEDIAAMLELYDERQGACWAEYLEKTVHSEHMQCVMKELEIKRLESRPDRFCTAQSVVEYYRDNLTLFEGEARKDVAVQAQKMLAVWCQDNPERSAEIFADYIRCREEIAAELTIDWWETYKKQFWIWTQQDSNSRITCDSTIEALLKEAERLKVLENPELREELLSEGVDILSEKREGDITLMQEFSQKCDALEEQLGERLFQLLQEKVIEIHNSAVTRYTPKEHSIEEMKQFCERYIQPYQTVIGRTSDDVFQRICGNYISYEDLIARKTELLGYISEEKYRKVREQLADKWKDAKRKQIKELIDEFREKRFADPEYVQKMANILNQILGQCENDKDRRELSGTIKKKLDATLSELEPTPQDTPEYFDALEGLCDLSIWKNRIFDSKPESKKMGTLRRLFSGKKNTGN